MGESVCVTGPTLQGMALKWTMAKGAKCPVPGGPGIQSGGQYNFDGIHWFCAEGAGIQNDGPARNLNRDPGYVAKMEDELAAIMNKLPR